MYYLCIDISPFSTIGSIHDSHCIAFTGISNINVKNLDPYNLLNSIKVPHINRLIIGQLNNKIEVLKLFMKGTLDILIVTESKLDEPFPNNQFCTGGYASPFRADRTKNRGGVIIYVRVDIPSKELTDHQLLILKVSFFKSISRKEKMVSIWWLQS